MRILLKLLLNIFVVSIYTISSCAQYKISTVVGSYGWGVDALKTNLSFPEGLTIDNLGNLYVADLAAEVVKKIDLHNGKSYIIAGTGEGETSPDSILATKASLNDPVTVRTDTQGNVYIADRGNYSIRKIDVTTGTITTIAGTGSCGFSGDGGLAINANLGLVNGLLIAGNGDVYFSDSSNQRIRKIDITTGIITTVAGNGQWGNAGDGGLATQAQLAFPTELAYDSKGNIYFLENYRIRVINKVTGIISTIAGNNNRGNTGDGGTAAAALLSDPSALFLDSQDNIYISDTGNHRIRKIDATTQIITTIIGIGSLGFSGDDGLANLAEINRPDGLFVSTNGDIFFSDQGNHRIRKVDGTTRIITTVAGSGKPGLYNGYIGDGDLASRSLLNAPYAMAVDLQGNQYIADRDNHRVRKIDANTGLISTLAGTGESGYSGDGGLATLAKLNKPVGITTDLAGNVYIVEEANHCLRKVDGQTGIISTVAGDGIAGYTGDGGSARNARFTTPWSVVIDKNDNIYIADRGNYCIRRISTNSGNISTIAGTGVEGDFGDGGLAKNSQFKHLAGLAVDVANNLYICDTYAYKVRKINTSTGLISTIAGTGSYGLFFRDGSSATRSKLAFPAGIALDSKGNMYITDQERSSVYRVNLQSNKIWLFAGSRDRGYYGDGGLATKARLGDPRGIAIDANQHIYIVDAQYSNVRKLVPQPRIDVRIGLASIYEKATYDFGRVSYNTSKIVEFNVKNTGLATLEIQNISLTGGFTIPMNPSFGNLEIGESIVFSVKINADNIGQQSGKLTIRSNDGINSTRTLYFSGSVYKAIQVITFDTIPQKTYGDADFTLTASGGSSRNPVSFESSDQKIVKISGSTATIIGAGYVTIFARQKGNQFYTDAPTVKQSIFVNLKKQYIEFSLGNDTLKTKFDSPFGLKAKKLSSQNPVIFSSSDPLVATVSGNQVTIKGIGITYITAVQQGSSYYHPSNSVTQKLVVIPTTGLPKEFANAQLTLFPNPVREVLNVKITGNVSNKQVQVMIFNDLGKPVLYKKTVLKSISLNTGIGSFSKSTLYLPKRFMCSVRYGDNDLNRSASIGNPSSIKSLITLVISFTL